MDSNFPLTRGGHIAFALQPQRNEVLVGTSIQGKTLFTAKINLLWGIIPGGTCERIHNNLSKWCQTKL